MPYSIFFLLNIELKHWTGSWDSHTHTHCKIWFVFYMIKKKFKFWVKWCSNFDYHLPICFWCSFEVNKFFKQKSSSIRFNLDFSTEIFSNQFWCLNFLIEQLRGNWSKHTQKQINQILKAIKNEKWKISF